MNLPYSSGAAFERITGARDALFAFSCEHAGRALDGLRLSATEAALAADHWGWDIGAGDLTRALAQLTGSPAVLSTFSRLVCDPNRGPDEESFVVDTVAGQALAFNRGLPPEARAERARRTFEPYHAAFDAMLAEQVRTPPTPWLCSVHSFTPEFDGHAREMELGVLFDAHEDWAEGLAEALGAQGFRVARNEPYSGYAGLIYAASRHGRAHGVPYLEIEVRNDLLRSSEGVEAVAERVARALVASREALEVDRSAG
ncbi:MAG: N-formylglutamate amidohydrolase [Myxococcota bacterium]